MRHFTSNLLLTLTLLALTSFWAQGQRKKSGSFKAPVIYSLASHPMMADSNIKADGHGTAAASTSIAPHADTVVKIESKHSVTTDTVFQQHLDTRLDSIQKQLTGLKTIVRNQTFEAKLQYLLYQQDSLRALKRFTLAQKIVSREDNLKVKIYDLQIDSIRNESEKLQRRAEAGFDQLDSSWMQMNTFSPVMPVVIAAPPDTLQKKIVDTLAIYRDSLTANELAELKKQLSATNEDQLYARDSAYRKTVDSLRQTLLRYELVQHNQPGYNKDEMKSESDTAHYVSSPGDSLSRDTLQNDLVYKKKQADLQNRLALNNDTLTILKQSVQQNQDSAAYYRRLLFAARSDSSQSARKWYQKIIPGSAKKQRNAQEEMEQQLNEKEDYYNNRLNQLNDRVNRLQQDNTRLNTDYTARRRSQDEHILVQLPAYANVNTDDKNDRRDMNDLRREINQLNNQMALQRAAALQVPPVNYNGNNRQTDTVYIKIPAVETQPLTKTAQPVTNDSLLRSEIQDLKAEVNALKNKAAKTATVTNSNTPATTAAAAQTLTIYFASGASRPSVDQQNKLTAFIKNAGASANSVYGLAVATDASGSPAINKALAEKRLKAVQSLLISQFGADEKNIKLSEPSIPASSSRKQNPLDRKVTITLEHL